MVKKPWRRTPRTQRRDILESFSLPDVLPFPSDTDGPPSSAPDSTTTEGVPDPSDPPPSTHQSSMNHVPTPSSLPPFVQSPSTEVVPSIEPSAASTQTDVLISDIPSMVTSIWVLTSGAAVVTITSIVPNPTLAQFSERQDNSFFSNKAAVIATFTVVGIMIIAFFAALFLILARRRKAIQFQREQDKAARAAARVLGFGFLDELEDTYQTDEKSWGSSVAVGVQPVRNLGAEYGYTLPWAHPYTVTSGSQSAQRHYADYNHFDTLNTAAHTVHPYAFTTRPTSANDDVPTSFAPLTGLAWDNPRRCFISFNTNADTSRLDQELESGPPTSIVFEGPDPEPRPDSTAWTSFLPSQDAFNVVAFTQDDRRPPDHMASTRSHQTGSPTTSATSQSNSSVSRISSAHSEEDYTTTIDRAPSPHLLPQRSELRFSGIFGTPHDTEVCQLVPPPCAHVWNHCGRAAEWQFFAHNGGQV